MRSWMLRLSQEEDSVWITTLIVVMIPIVILKTAITRISRWFEQLRRLTKGSSELRCTPRSGKTPKQRSIHGAAIGTTPTTTTNSASAHPEECSTQRATANGDLHRLQPDGGKQLRVPPTRICELRYVLIA
uniref:Uncharacterized protein n=1 Tax=Ascaris lumbricoides TaxID=6252 RepID=A0A0M3HQP6_ASCLU